jgi:glycine/D-amino acid oxidase-like deaminating enzyme
VTAAGPWSARVTAQLGVELPVRARHRTVTVFECPEPLPGFPLVIDPTGAYVRPEGKGYVAGTSPGPGEPDPDDRPLDPDPEIFETRVWPAIAHRVPAFERLRVTAAWAGWYDYNTVDQNGLVGRLPGFENAYVTTGFSGHGIQQAPAVGCGLAELILDGRYRTIDLGPLDPIRIVQGRPLLERNVI